MNFNHKGQDTMVEFIYPWLPNRCSICEKWGHIHSSCVAMKPEGSRIQHSKSVEASVNNRELKQHSAAEERLVNEPGEVSTSLSNSEQSRNRDVAVERSETEQEEETLSTTLTTINNLEQSRTREESEWSIVSPGKSARSPNGSKNTLEFGQVTILSGSRFSALEVAEEATEQGVEDSGLVASIEQIKPPISEHEGIRGEQNHGKNIQMGDEDKGIEKSISVRQLPPRASKISQNKAQETHQSTLKKRSSQRNN